MAAGTCFGKFTKTKKFKLHVTCLDYLAQYARYKVWVKPGGEMSFLYGNHVAKAHLGRITESTPQYQGVVVFSMADVPLGEWACVCAIGPRQRAISCALALLRANRPHDLAPFAPPSVSSPLSLSLSRSLRLWCHSPLDARVSKA